MIDLNELKKKAYEYSKKRAKNGGMIKKLTMTECELCGKSFMRNSPSQRFCCRECYKEFKLRQRPPGKRRFSGRSYKTPEQRLNEIREKYKNGVTAEIMQEFAENLQIPRDLKTENWRCQND